MPLERARSAPARAAEQLQGVGVGRSLNQSIVGRIAAMHGAIRDAGRGPTCAFSIFYRFGLETDAIPLRKEKPIPKYNMGFRMDGA